MWNEPITSLRAVRFGMRSVAGVSLQAATIFCAAFREKVSLPFLYSMIIPKLLALFVWLHVIVGANSPTYWHLKTWRGSPYFRLQFCTISKSIWASSGQMLKSWQSSANSKCVIFVPLMIIGLRRGALLSSSVRVKRAAKNRMPEVVPPCGTPRECTVCWPVLLLTVIKYRVASIVQAINSPLIPRDFNVSKRYLTIGAE